MFNQQSILVIGGGGDCLTYVYEEMADLGLQLYLADEPHAMFADIKLREKLFKGFIPVHFDDNSPEIPDRVFNALRESRDVPRPHGILTFNEQHVRFIPSIAAKLGLPSMSHEAVIAAQNKAATRTALKAASVRSVKHTVIPSGEIGQLPEAISAVGLPAIFKPCNGYHSVGVRFAHTKEEASAAYEEITDIMRQSSDPVWKQGSDIVIEEFIEGRMFAAETILVDGKLMFLVCHQMKYNDPPWFEDHVFFASGSLLTAHEKHQIEEYISNCLAALGFTSGQFDIEFKLDPRRGPILIEVNPRMGCGPMRDLTLQTYGVDLIETAVRLSLGMTIPDLTNLKPEKHLAGIYVQSPCSGIVDNIRPLYEISHTDKRVIGNRVMAEKGQYIVGRDEGMPSELSLLIVSADKESELEATLTEVVRKIKLPLRVGNNTFIPKLTVV